MNKQHLTRALEEIAAEAVPDGIDLRSRIFAALEQRKAAPSLPPPMVIADAPAPPADLTASAATVLVPRLPRLTGMRRFAMPAAAGLMLLLIGWGIWNIAPTPNHDQISADQTQQTMTPATAAPATPTASETAAPAPSATAQTS
ncbi:MAG TPA: hypothetical protein VGE07_02000, partial [Herpetosiphonaceae bacterium]